MNQILNTSTTNQQTGIPSASTNQQTGNASAISTLPQHIAGHLQTLRPLRAGTPVFLRNIIWYSGTRERNLHQAREWQSVLIVPTGQEILAGPNDWDACRQELFRQFGPGFHFTVNVDRRDNTMLRILVRLTREVTATQAVYNAFIDNAEREDRQAKSLAAAPRWDAWSGGNIAGPSFHDPGEGFQ